MIAVVLKVHLILLRLIAEHIEEKYILNLLEIFKNVHLIFTAAPPGWGGVGHVNEQNENHWIKTLERHNFTLDVNNTNVIRKYLS